MRTLLFLLLVTLASAPGAAPAATLCVTPGGTGGCFATIQQALDAARSRDVIDVAAGTYVENVTIPEGKAVTLHGAGPGATIIDGNNAAAAALKLSGRNPGRSTIDGIGLRNASEGLSVTGIGNVTLANCTISGNRSGIVVMGSRVTLSLTSCSVTGNGPAGGGISFTANGKLTITDSVISDNVSDASGGIASWASLTIVDSTVSDNTTAADGGGISIRNNKLTVRGSTISGNVSSGRGGGIFSRSLRKVSIGNSTISNNAAVEGGGIDLDAHRPVTLDHVTIAGNSASLQGGGLNAHAFSLPKPTTLSTSLIADNTAATGPDCSADRVLAIDGDLIENTSGCTIATAANSVVITQDPLLGPLQNNGGATETQALGVGSPAIGVVTSPAACASADQRGVPRIVPCDLGAYEAP